MDASHDTHDTDGGFWTFGNMVLAVLFGGFAVISSGSLMWHGLFYKAPPTPPPAAAAPGAAPAAPASSDPQTVLIKTSPTNPLAYDKNSFTVKTGEKIHVTFNNDAAIPMPHSLIICKVGTKDKVLGLATALLSDPNGLAKGYIPDSPDILAHTKLLQPKESETLDLDPLPPGDYPYFCTFPGHALVMNGLMKVVK